METVANRDEAEMTPRKEPNLKRKRSEEPDCDEEGAPEKKLPKPNPGGGSTLQWFNKLAGDPLLRPVLDHLADKIKDVVAPSVGSNDCLDVKGFKPETRIVADKKFKPLLDAGFPERFSPYVVAMAKSGKLVPDRSPPNHPHLRKVRSRAGSTLEAQATWVASHLCHRRTCCNPSHLV